MRKYFGVFLFVLAAVVISSPMAHQQGNYVTVNSVTEVLASGPDHYVYFKLTINKLGGLTYNPATSTSGGAPVGTSTGGAPGGNPPVLSTSTSTSSSSSSTSTTGGGSQSIIVAKPALFVGGGGTSVSASDMYTIYHYPTQLNQGGWLLPCSVGNYFLIERDFGANPTATCGADVGIDYLSSGHHTYIWDTYSMTRSATTAVSCDSRVMYGNPNVAGAVPGDQRNANASLKDVNFNNWIYQGGLFCGNAPFQTGDQSGRSRIQAYIPTAPSGNPVLAADLVLYYLQRANGFTDNFTLQSYQPSPNDPNITTLSSALVWSKAWIPSYSGATPLTSVNTVSLSSPQPVNFPLNTSSTVYATNVGLYVNPEPNPGDTSPIAWLYFGSPAYASSITGASDYGPRTWFCQATFLSSYHN